MLLKSTMLCPHIMEKCVWWIYSESFLGFYILSSWGWTCGGTTSFMLDSCSLEILSNVFFDFACCKWILMGQWSMCWELQDSILLWSSHLFPHGWDSVPHTASAIFSLLSDLTPHPLPMIVGIWIGMAEVDFSRCWQWHTGLVTSWPSWASYQLPFRHWVHLRMEAVGYYDVRRYNMLIKSWIFWELQRQPPRHWQ